MEHIAFLFYYVTPYIAVVVFVGGIASQLYRWRQSSPVSAHLSLFPRPQSRLGRLVDTLVDMFTLKGLLRVNKPLWVGGFIMHVGLLFVLVGHVRAFTDFYFLWNLLRWGGGTTAPVFSRGWDDSWGAVHASAFLSAGPPLEWCR